MIWYNFTNTKVIIINIITNIITIITIIICSSSSSIIKRSIIYGLLD